MSAGRVDPTSLFNGGGSPVSSVPMTIGSFESTMNALDAQLTVLTPNSTVNTTNPNNFQFNGSGGSTDIFSISATSLESAHGISITPNGATSIIVNVTGGGSVNLTANFEGTVPSQNIIWNFENATGVSVPGWDGAILAREADVSNNAPINGAVIANSFSGTSELHNFAYQGTIPCFTDGMLIRTVNG
jgi:choice-of-anchor A domain-containing protein